MAKSFCTVVEVAVDEAGSLVIHGLLFRIIRRELRTVLKAEPEFELVQELTTVALAKMRAAKESKAA